MPAVTRKLRVVSPLWSALLLVPLLLLLSSLRGSRTPSVSLQSRDIHHHEHPLANLTHRLNRRDDYSCTPSKPCANGACCGQSGYCGYGATYCGTGCSSNCNAHAECGKDAVPAGKTCPLNTCCSQYGFCGTTGDFCTNGCQSNCVQHPSPPAGGIPNGALNRVIGYYESWASRLSCHKIQPTDLPLSALTHLNYAFGYIDPNTFDIVTMDSATPVDLFSQTTAVKKINPLLKVYISVGGWTFSDNGTATQPVFGNIASSQANRQKFSNNLMRFINNYGFDGLDIDWEYPGAPDRGGTPGDTQNFVSLMQTLRSTFNSAPRAIGLTFTAPSSYWYLRWFDLPGLLQYSDWINFMTYDLHGVWDRNNPIGSIVQGHTNLTEIKLATELLWRVNVPPGKVSLGYGFYGRSFQLASSSCSTPGCQFTGGADPGPCSATSGVLMYYEIQALLSQHSELKPVWDQTAAVKYVVFNGNQWVSYDDGDTFKQKVQWANSVGLGGGIIWAADTDDSNYTAIRALTGKDVAHPNTASINNKGFDPGDITGIVANLIGQNGQNCTQVAICQDGPKAGCNQKGLTKIGWNHDQNIQGGDVCKGRYDAVPICCPSATAPQNCMWRGSGPECDGLCHVGEVPVAWSEHGGGPNEEQSGFSKCNRGKKVYCCQAGDWTDVVKDCNWKCSCDSTSETSVLTAYSVNQTAFSCPNGAQSNYCCPKNTPLNGCHWQGTPHDCADNACASNEVTVAQDIVGDLLPFQSFSSGNAGCFWARQRSACCKVSVPPASSGSQIKTCPLNFCDFNVAACADGTDDDDLDDSDDGITKRNDLALYNSLEKRASLNQYPFARAVQALTRSVMLGRRVPVTGFINGRLANQDQINYDIQPVLYRPGHNDDCDSPTVITEPITTRPPNSNIEHVLGPNTHQQFMWLSANQRGPVPNNRYWLRAPTSPVLAAIQQLPDAWITNTLNSNNALQTGLTRYPSNSEDLTMPAARIMETSGSTTNFHQRFTICWRSINYAKGKFEEFARPVSASVMTTNARAAVANADDTMFQGIVASLSAGINVYQYLAYPAVSAILDQEAADAGNTYAVIGSNTGIGNLLRDNWNTLYPMIQQARSAFARQWMVDMIQINRNAINAAPATPQTRNWLSILTGLEGLIPTMKYQFEGTVTTPSPSSSSSGSKI